MKKILTTILFLLSIGILPLTAHETKKEDTLASSNSELDISIISKAFGHLISKNLDTLNINFDMKEVVIGIQEHVRGVESPMTEPACLQAITQLQENAFQKQADNNLQQAEAFLEKNKLETGVIELEPGKVQYQCLNKGTGAVVEAHYSPVIRYVGKFLDGKTFGESTEEEVISLDETIQGFNKAIVGMKEGEKRRVFIHPEYGYGTAGFLPPNSLLTFEIEVIKANAPKAEEPSVTSSSVDSTNHLDEIAHIDTLEEGIR